MRGSRFPQKPLKSLWQVCPPSEKPLIEMLCMNWWKKRHKTLIRYTFPYIQPEMKFRSPPGQFHYEPPLLQPYFLAVCSMDYGSKKNGMSILDVRKISRRNLLIGRMLSHLSKRFSSAMGYKMITSDQQKPFYCSWVYTFSATPRSLRIWAPVPPRETGCDPALPAQLCWSSGSSFPHRLYDLM